MEGVLVSAKRAGSTITITVVTDAQGQYSFPQSRLEPGQYSIRIRAVGYDLDDPGPVDVKAQASTKLDLKLHKTKNLLAQLSNGEWLMSMPGTEAQKQSFIGCTTCHNVDRKVVGAAGAIRRPPPAWSCSRASSLATVVVLPVPGPPASTLTQLCAATAAASR